ncbi:MAG: hypothetical protein GXO47_09680 [Chlorobi bacterium]|nr:hypothetical protein [Chlorobiota bacterium]
MRKSILTFVILIIISFLSTTTLNSQEEAMLNKCIDNIQSPFIVSGQPFKAFITDDEVAEFHTTLFSGSTYRIVACSAKEPNIIFSVYDTDRNLLFSNKDYDNSPYWDFKVEGSIECIVEARLDKSKATSGIALILVGFKSSEQDE